MTPRCVASNSHLDRVRHALSITRLLPLFDPHVFSASQVARGKPAPDLFLIGLAALGLVAERAAEIPLLFVVEDAHWLDRPSSEVLKFVARRVESDPALLLLPEGERRGLVRWRLLVSVPCGSLGDH